jgi:predicted NAD/FAD-binding protein
MTKTEIKAIRLRIKTQIAKLIAQLNNESRRFYEMFNDILRFNSIGMLIDEWIGELNEYTEDAYISLNEDYNLLTDLQLLHRQLFELDVLEQAI